GQVTGVLPRSQQRLLHDVLGELPVPADQALHVRQQRPSVAHVQGTQKPLVLGLTAAPTYYYGTEPPNVQSAPPRTVSTHCSAHRPVQQSSGDTEYGGAEQSADHAT